MSSQQRINIFPTRMSLNNMKIKQRGAAKGHSLLKRKSDALTNRFRQILQKIQDAKVNMSETLKAATFSLAQVNYTAGDISFSVREAVTGPAQFKVNSRNENVSGVQLPIFEVFLDGNNAFELTGLGRGGQQIIKCKDAFVKSLNALIELASLQTAFFILDEVIRVTNRRVNALEYVVLPRVENTINYIAAELDEQDREEFFRLKKIQAKKKRETKVDQVALAGPSESEPKNILVNEDDADLIF